jgi:chromate transporter
VNNSETQNERMLIDAAPSPWRLFWMWAVIGAQSFGGGAATLYLIRRMAVERNGWLTDEEFTRYWGICQIAPGINILGLVILIGFRVAGALGAALSLAGLVLPSAAITIGLTSIYASIRDTATVRAAIAGVIPATVGLGLLLSFMMVRPLLNDAGREGRASAFVAAALLLASAIVAALGRTPVLAILWGTGVLCAVAQWKLSTRQRSPR